MTLKQLEQLLRSIYLEGEGSYVKYDSQICDSHLGYLLKLRQGLSVCINVTVHSYYLQRTAAATSDPPCQCIRVTDLYLFGIDAKGVNCTCLRYRKKLEYCPASGR